MARGAPLQKGMLRLQESRSKASHHLRPMLALGLPILQLLQLLNRGRGEDLGSLQLSTLQALKCLHLKLTRRLVGFHHKRYLATRKFPSVPKQKPPEAFGYPSQQGQLIVLASSVTYVDCGAGFTQGLLRT